MNAVSGTVKKTQTVMTERNERNKKERKVKAEDRQPPAPDQLQLTAPANAESEPPKNLTLAERAATTLAEQDDDRAKIDEKIDIREVPDDAFLTSGSRTLTTLAEQNDDRAKIDQTIDFSEVPDEALLSSATRALMASLKNMKTVFKTLSPTKRRSTTSHLPPATVTAILEHLLNLIPALHKKYARYDEVDAAM